VKFNLKEIRQAKDISQKELAKMSGVPRATICGIETGIKDNVTVKTLQALSDALNVQLSDLFLP